MPLLLKSYRRSYLNEDIVVERRYEGGIWHDTLEEVPNVVTNRQISNRAVVIGNGTSRNQIPLQHLKNPSGLLGAKTVQTYGCNALYRDFNPDFLVATGNEIVSELASSSYVENNIVYTASIHLLEYPNKFYLIPKNPYLDAGSTALYLAAFDGHKKIWMLGFDGQDGGTMNNNVYAGSNGYDAIDVVHLNDKLVRNQKSVFDVYNDVEFVRVTLHGTEKVPELWKQCPNFRQTNLRGFVVEADLS